jgi:hypothetical protein
MSATADAGKFSQYFKTPELGDFPKGERPWRNAPIINVDPAEPFNINVYYMDSLKQLGVSSHHRNFNI